MASILTADDLTSLVPDIEPAWAQLYADAVNAEVDELAPGGVPASIAPRVKLLLLVAIQQAAQSKPWLASETTGPYAVVYRTGARPGGLLTAFELAELRRMLGLAPSMSGALGRFPPPGDYDRLFDSPRAPVYISPGVTLVSDAGVDVVDESTDPTSSLDGSAADSDLDSGITQEQLDAL